MTTRVQDRPPSVSRIDLPTTSSDPIEIPPSSRRSGPEDPIADKVSHFTSPRFSDLGNPNRVSSASVSTPSLSCNLEEGPLRHTFPSDRSPQFPPGLDSIVDFHLGASQTGSPTSSSSSSKSHLHAVALRSPRGRMGTPPPESNSPTSSRSTILQALSSSSSLSSSPSSSSPVVHFSGQTKIQAELQPLTNYFKLRKSGDLEAMVNLILKCYRENQEHQKMVVQVVTDILKLAHSRRTSEMQALLGELFLKKDAAPFFSSLLREIGIEQSAIVQPLLSFCVQQTQSELLEPSDFVDMLLKKGGGSEGCFYSFLLKEPESAAEAIAQKFREQQDCFTHRPSRELLYLLFQNEQLIPFFPVLLKKMGVNLDQAAKSLIDYFIQELRLGTGTWSGFTDIIIKHSQHDVEEQGKKLSNGAVLFREASFGSSLVAQVGFKLDILPLEEIKKCIEGYLEQLKPGEISNLCIDLGMIRSQLEKDPLYLELSLQEREDAVIEKGKQNIQFFNCFATKVLEQITSLSFNRTHRSILASRREQVVATLQLHRSHLSSSSEPSSSSSSSSSAPIEGLRPLMGSAVFLRLITPYIISLQNGKPPEEQSVLRSLAKLVQNLSNEIPFGQKVKDPVLEGLNPVFDYFLPKCQELIDRCCIRG